MFRIALAAPARKVSPDEMMPAISMLQQWGMEVFVPHGLYEEHHQMAGTDSHRAALLQSLLDDDSLDAILCCRGGYGTVRIIDHLNFARFARHPKRIVGYSDITVLHSHIHRTLSLPTLHATMPINMDGSPTPATDTLRQALLGESLHYTFSPHPFNRQGRCTAPIVGGNLSILYSLLGSPSDIDTRGKILLIEDLDEYLYHIDRMLQALRRAGKLDGLQGLIVGALSDMHDNSIPFGLTAEEIVREAVEDYNFPVVFQAHFGHIGAQNRALPLGVPATLSVDSMGVATLEIPH
ncbi:MAG: LD-carboxypeptidase [Bacteroidales bacterium]|nr:LD-carboxypeptidase [Bacteroidales bacterium]